MKCFTSISLILYAFFQKLIGANSTCRYEFKDELRFELQNKGFPWNAVVITRNNSSTQKYLFMGTLISQWAVLTTAIDIIELMGTESVVEVYLTNDSTQKFTVEKMIPLDWYNRTDQNIGILILSSPVKINMHVFPACMDHIPVIPVTEIGYGEVLLWTFKENNSGKGVLEIVPVQIYPAERCKIKDEPLDKSKPYCVKLPDSKKTQQYKFGNRGASLVVNHFNKYYVKAIWSGHTDETSQYWCFTDLQPYTGWIKKTLDKYTPTNRSPQSSFDN